MRRAAHKDMRRFLAAAVAAGLEPQFSKRGHIKFMDANGRIVASTGSTPSDPRALKNRASELRRAGFEVRV